MTNLESLIKNLTQTVELNNKALQMILDNLVSLAKRVSKLEETIYK